MNRIVAVVAFFTIVLVACGVDRASEDTLAEDAETSADEAAADENGDGSEESEDDGGSGDGAAETGPTSTLAPATPPTTGAPGDVALSADFGDEMWEITHGQLNEVVTASQENEEFVSLVFQGAVPPGFTTGVLTEWLTSQAVQFELAELGLSVSEEDLADSKVQLLSQVETLYPATADPAAEADRLYEEVPYLAFLTEYQARQNVLSDALSEAADPGEGVPCVRHILVETEAEGDDIITRLDGGEDFGDLAIELSTGPSGPSGGELGCAASSNYVPPFAAAVDEATVGEFVGPVQTDFGWHVIVVDGFEVDGRALASDQLRERLSGASVDVDDNLGSWDPARLVIIPMQG